MALSRNSGVESQIWGPSNSFIVILRVLSGGIGRSVSGLAVLKIGYALGAKWWYNGTMLTQERL